MNYSLKFEMRPNCEKTWIYIHKPCQTTLQLTMQKCIEKIHIMIRYEIMYAVWVHIDQIEYNFKVRYLFYYET